LLAADKAEASGDAELITQAKLMNRALQLDAEVDRFLAENPHVWQKFRLLAVKIKAKGFDRWGAKSLWEVLRWEMALETNAAVGGPKLNNSYVSRIARRLMEDPEFEGFFETRQLKGGEHD
jgi:hypothetical protein